MQGIIFFRIDPGVFLLPLMQAWPIPSNTAETLLIQRENEGVVFVSALRHHPSPPLSRHMSLSRDDLPAVQAALGKEGIVQGRDYRGEQVMAAIRAIPDSNWFVVAKMDQKEILAELERYGLRTAGTVGALILAAGWAGLFLWRRQQVGYLAGLAQSEAEQGQKLQGILSALPDQVLLLDRAGRSLFINQAALETFGQVHRDYLGRPFADLGFPAEVADLLASRIAALAAAGGTLTGEISLAPAQGIRYFDYILTPLPGGGEPAAAILATFRPESSGYDRKAVLS